MRGETFSCVYAFYIHWRLEEFPLLPARYSQRPSPGTALISSVSFKAILRPNACITATKCRISDWATGEIALFGSIRAW